jgi:importin subunit alpha-1
VAGVIDRVLMVLNDHPRLTMLRNATWTISNLCRCVCARLRSLPSRSCGDGMLWWCARFLSRGKPQPDFEIVSRSLPTLAQLIYSGDSEVTQCACTVVMRCNDVYS